VSRLVIPADPRQAAIAVYNSWHAANCTCPGWREFGFCDKRADAGDPPDFLYRITVNYARHELSGYDRAYSQLARRTGRETAREVLRSAVYAAIEARLGAAAPVTADSASTVGR
jgi:hypothetical protein